MRQHILTTALAAAVTALSYGQNLNPTVEVTNAYEGGASSIVKPLQQMAVPDSVTTFNLDFDYSVFENPYRGAYEFKPYYVQLKPAPNPSTEEKFYLRAGAGFTLHPDLDLVWTPVRKERFQMGVYATHHSYFGRYHQFGLVQQDDVWLVRPGGDKMKGYLADTRAGVDGRYGWDGGEAVLDLSYRHRMADNAFHYQKMGGLEARGRVRSLPSDAPYFLYDAAVDYHFLGGDLSHAYPATTLTRDVAESGFRFDGTFGPVLDADHRVLVDLDLDLARYMRDYTGYTGLLSVTPKYQFNMDRWRFSLGAKVSAIIYSEDFNLWPEALRHKSGLIYPDVRVDYSLLDDALILQASATGGDRSHTFSGRFFSRPFVDECSYGHSIERVRAMLGVRGSVAARFRYDLQGGYAREVHSAEDALLLALAPGAAWPEDFSMGLTAYTYNLFFADLDFGWESESVLVDGRLSWRHSKMPVGGVLSPAAITGFVRPAYRWGGRFKGGLEAAFSTARSTSFESDISDPDLYPGAEVSAVREYRVPGWVDLGLFAEYRFTHHFGFWAKGGNLLNQAVQHTPLVAEAGMYGTLGIVLNF